MTKLLHFPVEVLLQILEYLGKSPLNYFSQVCQHFHAISNHALYKRNFANALWQATEKGNPETLRKLLKYLPRTAEYDARYTIWSPIGHTPMSAAAYGGNTEVVQILLDNGFDPGALDRNGYMPLSWAARYGHASVITVLLGTGLEPDQKDIFGRSPISWAAEYGHVGAVKVLLDHGADPNCPDDPHNIVEIRARQKGFDLVPFYLMNHSRLYKGQVPRTPLKWAERNSCAAVVQLLWCKCGNLEHNQWLKNVIEYGCMMAC
ncbi:ankyrin repeat-containing domain protein [Aspergillus leporis]|jgi:ankyrin repeat protein|uniref:Ankyrin repeat-containing domain protein n=1 Tax=Aspergillus leporis TaxID=41062 RepID=A0A5N5X8W1_9EURO|nr:ankyrin repeat-containing domain protein [Aspergillus leporis]